MVRCDSERNRASFAAGQPPDGHPPPEVRCDSSRSREILSSNVRASSAVSTGVLPFLAECFGPGHGMCGIYVPMM
jgi:hypothetical protein